MQNWTWPSTNQRPTACGSGLAMPEGRSWNAPSVSVGWREINFDFMEFQKPAAQRPLAFEPGLFRAEGQQLPTAAWRRRHVGQPPDLVRCDDELHHLRRQGRQRFGINPHTLEVLLPRRHDGAETRAVRDAADDSRRPDRRAIMSPGNRS